MIKNNVKKILFSIFIISILLFFRKQINSGYTISKNIVSKFNFKIVEYRSSLYNIAINFKDKVLLVSNVDEFIKENKTLKAELEKEKLALENIKELKEENRILRQNLELKNSINYDTIPVEVKLSEFFDEDILYLTKGYDAGIRLNQVVVYSGNMIGKITKVEKDYSEVTLLTSRDSKVSVILNNTYIAIIRGNGNGTFSIKNYNTDINIDNANYFELKTSGISDIILKDINIGSFSIKDKDTFRKTRELIFTPKYKYANIRVVLVLKEVKE